MKRLLVTAIAPGSGEMVGLTSREGANFTAAGRLPVSALGAP